MKKLFTLIAALCALTACSSLEEENFGTGTGKTAKVSFNVGGEISTEYESITRAGSPVYEIFIDEKTADNAVTPYLHGTFSTLEGVVAELPVGKEYLFAIQYAPVGSATEKFAAPTSTDAVAYNSENGYTHYSYTASYEEENVYYGEKVENITATGAQTVSINALYCDFGLKFNVTKPLNGTLTVTSTEPAFTYTYSADGESTFPEEVVCYTMKHPWTEDESITLTVTYSEDNYTKEVVVTPKRNKAAKLNINMNPPSAQVSFTCSLESVAMEDIEVDIDRDAEEEEEEASGLDADGNIIFADAAFKAYMLANFDTNNDGKLSIEEAEEVTEINCGGDFNGYGIEPAVTGTIMSLKGIEYCINLITLNCSCNQLTSVDLSNNTELTTLTCSMNKITSLDLSKNRKLTSLTNILATNKLPGLNTINLSNCSELTNIVIFGNNLTTLDVSDCEKLTSLNCSSNQLEELDLSNNTRLQGLECNNNQLTSLDISNTQMVHLCCCGNPLTKILIYEGQAIGDLDKDDDVVFEVKQ